MLTLPINFRNFRLHGSGSQNPYDRLSPFVYGNAGDEIQYLALSELLQQERGQTLYCYNSFYPEICDLKGQVQPVDSSAITLVICGYTGLFDHMFLSVYVPNKAHVAPDHCIYLGVSISSSDERGGQDGMELALKLDLPHKLAPFGPIGCRDRATRDFLRAHGVDAYYSGCMTMGFAARTIDPKHPPQDTVILDLQPGFWPQLPPDLVQSAKRPTHCLLYRQEPESLRSRLEFFAQAKALLDYYREHAKLIITSRIHGTIPALALDIPVIFLSDCTDQRMDMLKYLIKQHRSSEQLNFEQLKRSATQHSYFAEVRAAVRENALDRLAGKDDRGSIRRLEQILEYDFLGQRTS
ncbi:MAG TPA: polysaccharide pyruvyl transferase family protein [Candidatus Anaerobiospirillum stercoravium]|nr:polysaccharide pyruvyl transferase family protein [Candidatus Anaerobiospirillum stercoravium]